MARKSNEKKESFAGIPRNVLRSDEYKKLSGNDVKLLLELAYQFRGYNNGDLTTAWAVLVNRGWHSRSTIDRAKKNLLDEGLIVETRCGRFLNPGGRCALYALTWLPIDECKGRNLDIKPTNVPPRRFR